MFPCCQRAILHRRRYANHGKLACTQVKCTWLLPIYVNEVPYARVKDIDFSSAKKFKENLDEKIDSLKKNPSTPSRNSTLAQDNGSVSLSFPSKEEMDKLFAKLNRCKAKDVVLSLIPPYADKFIDESCSVPVVSDLFNTDNLNLDYPELLKKCVEVNLTISDEQITLVEKTTRTQSKGSGFFRHRAGSIGASVSGAVFHTNCAQPSQSLIKTICYPN